MMRAAVSFAYQLEHPQCARVGLDPLLDRGDDRVHLKCGIGECARVDFSATSPKVVFGSSSPSRFEGADRRQSYADAVLTPLATAGPMSMDRVLQALLRTELLLHPEGLYDRLARRNLSSQLACGCDRPSADAGPLRREPAPLDQPTTAFAQIDLRLGRRIRAHGANRTTGSKNQRDLAIHAASTSAAGPRRCDRDPPLSSARPGRRAACRG